MNLKRFSLYYHTLRHLKPIQVYYQLYYRIRPQFGKNPYSGSPNAVRQIGLTPGIPSGKSFLGKQRFRFLNQEKDFEEIDWNYAGYGKLWAYNLNYFDFLEQEGMDRETGLALIRDYLAQAKTRKDGIEPYPISLRGINWVKFLSRHGITEDPINTLLYRDYCRLMDHLEYHLLANHLLENGFSLLFGAYYFQDEQFFQAAKKILRKELKEQILSDGAHFELSPMYHQIILHRVLDCYNLLKGNLWEYMRLLPLLRETAERMLGWLQAISWKDGSIPMVNDAAPGIAPSTPELLQYAHRLGLSPQVVLLDESGYRKFSRGDFEVLFDAGNILPAYQPGHAHADSLQVLMRYKGVPVLVDTGTSTYEKNERRQVERGTPSHNTVTLNGQDSSRVWGGFRVGKRAQATILEESPGHIKACHNGYRPFHCRTVTVLEKEIRVTDEVSKNVSGLLFEGHLHFAPGTVLKKEGNSVGVAGIRFYFDGVDSLELSEYECAMGFNVRQNAPKIIYSFTQSCQISIRPETRP